VISDDEELMGLMVQAGFKKVFWLGNQSIPRNIGGVRKFQNLGRRLVADVNKDPSIRAYPHVWIYRWG
jgi:hypothetical protein